MGEPCLLSQDYFAVSDWRIVKLNASFLFYRISMLCNDSAASSSQYDRVASSYNSTHDDRILYSNFVALYMHCSVIDVKF